MKNSKIGSRGLIIISHLENDQWNLIRTATWRWIIAIYNLVGNIQKKFKKIHNFLMIFSYLWKNMTFPNTRFYSIIYEAYFFVPFIRYIFEYFHRASFKTVFFSRLWFIIAFKPNIINNILVPSRPAPTTYSARCSSLRYFFFMATLGVICKIVRNDILRIFFSLLSNIQPLALSACRVYNRR